MPTAELEATAVLSALCRAGDWQPVGSGGAVRRRYRERVGPGGLVWTKTVIVLSPDVDDEPAGFSESAWQQALAATRWMLPPRGAQGATLALAVAVGRIDSAKEGWAVSEPRLKFATMCGNAFLDVGTRLITTNRAAPKLGRVLHQRRLAVLDELAEAAARC